MTTEAAQLQFAAEFTLFVAAIAAVALTALRPDLLTRRALARILLVGGSVALAVAAFLHGSLLVDDAEVAGLVGLRLAGIAAVAGAVAGWEVTRGSRAAAALGVVALAGAEALVVADLHAAGDAVRGVGALCLAAGLLVASRRAIAARVAMSAATVVLLVVTALSIALTVVVAENVEDEVARRYEARAETESQVFADVSASARVSAELLARLLGGDRADQIRVATNPAAPPDAAAGAGQEVVGALAAFRTNVLQLRAPGPMLVVGANGRLAGALDLDDAARIAMLGDDAIAQVLATREAVDAVRIVGNQTFAVGAAPIVTTDGVELLGVAAITVRLDDGFLVQRVADRSSSDQDVGLALADRSRVYAESGRQAGLAETLTVAGDVLREGERRTAVDDDRFLVAVPVLDDEGTPVLAVVVTVPQARIDATRQDLFQLLFLVALGAALLAMVLAGYAGNRIGAGLVRLTGVTGDLQQGRLSARAEVQTEDELGVLSTTFNQMAASIQSMTDDLRSAAHQESALRGRLEGVVAGMGEALIAVDARGRITDFNAAAEELLGVPARETLGRTLDKVCTVTGEDGVDVTARFVKPVVESWSAGLDVRGPSGQAVPVAVSAGPLRGPAGLLTGAVFVLRDVRREREVEQMKTEFIANVSHELRTPLTPVLGYADILATRDLKPEQTKRFATEIHESARKLLRVTDQLVQFATLAAGRLQLHEESVDPRQLLEGVARRWTDRLPDSHRLTRRVGRNLPPAVLDRRYVDVALDELIDNAVKYSPDGGRVRVSASVHENGHGRRLVLAVDDQGVGIDPERRETIFEDFAQADGSATRRFGGLGLGLALVSRIVRAHGGELSCTSKVGEGTTVRMILPLDDAGRPARAPEPPTAHRTATEESAPSSPKESP
ncbi:MAG TPA: ATP-binding protein [Acidimicrobiales bacterium]|nr:ATP-binding protein [Acidimicrobiales bacterium]